MKRGKVVVEEEEERKYVAIPLRDTKKKNNKQVCSIHMIKQNRQQ